MKFQKTYIYRTKHNVITLVLVPICLFGKEGNFQEVSLKAINNDLKRFGKSIYFISRRFHLLIYTPTIHNTTVMVYFLSTYL